MFENILIVLIVAAVAAIVTLLIMRARSKRARAAQSQDGYSAPRDAFAADQNVGGDPMAIKAGDLLEFGTEKFFVRGTLRISEGGYTWAEHFYQSDTSASRLWLTVEADPDVQVSQWRDRPDLDLQPSDKDIQVEGVRYSLVERGTASYRSEGTTGLNAQGGVDYADYEAPGGKLLAFERFDHGHWEVSTGENVPVGSFTIYSGS